MKRILMSIAMMMFATQAHAVCAEADYQLIEGDATVAISGRSYTPRCLRVKKGASVTILASGHHPLLGVQIAHQPVNPFDSARETETTQTRVMANVGTYGYFCTHHGSANGQGMAGRIQVIE